MAFTPVAQGQECLYVLSRLRGTVDALARPDLTLEAAVALPDCELPGCMPTALAIDPARRRVYVSRQNNGAVQVLDMRGIDAPVTISLGMGTSPADVALTADRTRLLVANLAGDSVSVINTATDAIVETIPVGIAPRSVAILPDGSRAFVANAGRPQMPTPSISVIDVAALEVIDTYPLTSPPAAVAVTPDGTQLYASLDNGTIAVFDLPQGPPARSIAVGRRPRGVAFVPDGSQAFVTNTLDDSVSPVDTATETADTAFAVGSGPVAIVISDDGATGYVANIGNNTLSVIDVEAETATSLGEQFSPFDLALGSCPLLPTPTPTVTSSPQPTVTGTPGAACVGDCNGDSSVSINELIVGVNIALGNSPASACPAFDRDSNGQVAINELIAGVNAALFGC